MTGTQTSVSKISLIVQMKVSRELVGLIRDDSFHTQDLLSRWAILTGYMIS